MFLPIVGMGLGIYGLQHCFTARRCKGTSQESQSQFYSQPFTNCSQSVHNSYSPDGKTYKILRLMLTALTLWA